MFLFFISKSISSTSYIILDPAGRLLDYLAIQYSPNFPQRGEFLDELLLVQMIDNQPAEIILMLKNKQQPTFQAS